MPRRDTGTETTPHPDGKMESIINDSQGLQFGMSTKVDRNAFTTLNQINDETMKKFEKLMRGQPVDG